MPPRAPRMAPLTCPTAPPARTALHTHVRLPSLHQLRALDLRRHVEGPLLENGLERGLVRVGGVVEEGRVDDGLHQSELPLLRCLIAVLEQGRGGGGGGGVVRGAAER